MQDDEYEDISDEELDQLVDSFTDDDLLDAYDEDEFEEIDESVEELNEILSRQARLRAKFRMKRTKVRREIKKKIVLKRRSNLETLQKRARKLAIKSIKQKFAKKGLDKMSFADKVRVEKIVAKRKNAVDRLTRKLIPKVRKLEQNRLIGQTTK